MPSNAEPTAQEPVFSIPAAVAQQVLDYLASRPYREVANLIEQLVNLDAIKSDDES